MLRFIFDRSGFNDGANLLGRKFCTGTLLIPLFYTLKRVPSKLHDHATLLSSKI